MTITHLTPLDHSVLAHTPASGTTGAPARDIAFRAFGSIHGPAIDRTIAILRRLSARAAMPGLRA